MSQQRNLNEKIVLKPETFLRQAFGESEIAKQNSKYPTSIQRPYIYLAMSRMAKVAVNQDQRVENLEKIAELIAAFDNEELDLSDVQLIDKVRELAYGIVL